MKYDTNYENALIKENLPLIEDTIRPLRFLPWDDRRSIALMSALRAIRSKGIDGKPLEVRIRENIFEDLFEEKRALREQGWSKYNLFSLNRTIFGGGGVTFLDLVRTPRLTEQLVLAREFERMLTAEEWAAAECFAHNCPLRDVGIWGNREVSVRRGLRRKWIRVYGVRFNRLAISC